MTTAHAMAEVFWTAFLALDEEQRRAFLERLIGDPELREDLLDAALIAERGDDPTRPLEEVLAASSSHQTRRSR